MSDTGLAAIWPRQWIGRRAGRPASRGGPVPPKGGQGITGSRTNRTSKLLCRIFG